MFVVVFGLYTFLSCGVLDSTGAQFLGYFMGLKSKMNSELVVSSLDWKTKLMFVSKPTPKSVCNLIILWIGNKGVESYSTRWRGP